jgi:hypothetical protein
MKTMTQFQAQIPHPLADYLPEFLPTFAVRTPAIRVLLLILIGKNGLEGSPVQVQCYHIGGSERMLG